MRFFGLLGCVVGIAIAATPALFAQTSFSSRPVADAFVTSGPAGIDRSNQNFGDAGALSLAAAGKPQGEFQSLLKFNLASAVSFFNATYGAGQWTLQSITLQLTAALPLQPIFNSSSAGLFSAVWQQNDAFVEGIGRPNSPAMNGVTFASLPSLLGPADETLGSFSFDGATSGSFVQTLLLPPGFTNDVLAGGDVTLRLFAGDANASFLFNSRDFPGVSSRPQLNIIAVPEPGALSLLALGAGLGAIAWRRRRRGLENSVRASLNA